MPASQPKAGDAEAARSEQSHSGKLLLRMPQSLHAELARAADEEGVSLNAFITGALASAVAWRRTDETAPRATAQEPAQTPPNGARAAALLAPPEHRSHVRSRVLMANFVVVAVAAVAAIVLLVVALASAL